MPGPAGAEAVQYRQDGEVRPVTSGDVNAYLSEAMGGAFTAKHFRTWHASAIAFAALREELPRQAVLDRVSQALGNTPTIARKSYIHPALLEPGAAEPVRNYPLPRATQWLSRAERVLIEFLRSACSGTSRN